MDIVKKNLRRVRVKGEIAPKFYDQTTLSGAERLWNSFIQYLAQKTGKRWLLPRFYVLGELKRIGKTHNLICNAGFEALLKRLSAENDYTGEINKCALGTGSCTASASDTTMETESYRNDTASSVASENVAYVTAYFTESECSGTYTEFANFIDGTASADTGQIWSHVCGLNWEKDGTTVLVVDCKYTFTNA